MNPCVDTLLVVLFFGGMVLGVWLSGFPVRYLLRDEPVLSRAGFTDEYPQLLWVLRLDQAAHLLFAVAGFLVVAATGSKSLILALGGLVIVLWAELPYAVLAVVTGVWIDRLTSRVGGPIRAIPTGRVREAGLLGVGLTALSTAVLYALRPFIG
jgi:hypothetical protein